MIHKILDHGSVELVNHMGDDNFIAECARMSTATEASEEKNRKLVDRLIRDRHTSPIEFGAMVFEIAMPIFVMRQWVRHRTGAFNEFSGRYSEFPDIYYIPEVERVQYQSTFNKQGSADSLPVADAEHFRSIMMDQSETAYEAYKMMVDAGMTRELARIVLPTNFYTKVRWTVNLHNLFHFIKLREDPHAQWEIREYAKIVHKIVAQTFPAATAAFENHIQNQVVISQEMAKQLAEHVWRLNDLSDGQLEFGSETKEFLRRFNGG